MPLVSSGSMGPAAGFGSQSRKPVCEPRAQGAVEGEKARKGLRGTGGERERKGGRLRKREKQKAKQNILERGEHNRENSKRQKNVLERRVEK